MVMAPVQQTPNTKPAQQSIPFRRSTIERSELLPQDQFTMQAGTQRVERQIDGSGYIYGVTLDVAMVTAGNAAATAFHEDAPWSVFDTVVLRDVNAELVNVTGYNLFLWNLAGAQYAVFFPDTAARSALFSTVTGAGATGGSFTFLIRVPAGINRRDLTGILPNQDRAQKYSLRHDIASGSASATGPIYTTAPTNFGTLTMQKIYENYSVPMPVGPLGQNQDVIPPSYGTFHFLTSIVSEAAPLGGSQINHFLKRIGNTIRMVILVFRSNNSRATAETNAPSSIRMRVGNDTIFNETYRYRRFLMMTRYGFDFPSGVLVYDAMHDFASGAGDELGDDYWHTQAITEAQFQINYPAAFGSTANSLQIVTDDLIFPAAA